LRGSAHTGEPVQPSTAKCPPSMVHPLWLGQFHVVYHYSELADRPVGPVLERRAETGGSTRINKLCFLWIYNCVNCSADD
jgi:hypothetical protein